MGIFTQKAPYATESYVDDADATLSGSLQTQIDGKSDLGHGHTESDISDLDKYTKAEVDTISGSLHEEIVTSASNTATTYYLHEDGSDISGYETLKGIPSDHDESFDSTTIDTGDGETLIDRYITTSGTPNTTTIVPGTWVWMLWAEVSVVSQGPHYLRAKWYRREQGGTEHYLFTQEQQITSVVATRYILDTAASGVDMDSTDRLVVYIYAQTDAVVDRTIGYYVEGIEMVTRFNTPVFTSLISDHGQLTGLADDDHSQYHTDGRGDTRYYQKYEVDTISGSLSAEIDSDISTHAASADHDGRYYTETEVDTISGSLQTNIDGKDNYASWSFAVDGDTKDAITSGDVLDFAGGDNVTILRSAEDQITISATVSGGYTNLDGGFAAAIYGGILGVDGGDASSF